MPLTKDKEKAVNYETLFTITGDRARAYRLLMALPDPEVNLDSAIPALSETVGKDGKEIAEIRKAIYDAFSSERIETKAIFPESPLFPKEEGEFFPVIYASGDLSLLSSRRVTVLGMPKPSMQGKSDALSVLSYFAEHDVTALVSLDDGIPMLSAEVMLRGNGRLIAVLSGPISKCTSEDEARLRGKIYASGLLLSIFPPSQRIERWLVMVRNSFMASISESVFLAEEKDGGPSWSVFDKVLAGGGRAMLSASMLDVPSYTWARRHIESGALTYSGDKDLKRIIPKAADRAQVPDLFS